jgi:acylphosphatase
MPTVHLLIEGRVQGVFYRASAKQMADKLGITGWVKNTPEGNVEILAKGKEGDIEEYINWCKQGPPKAVVTNLAVTKKDDTLVLQGFEILR